MIAAIIVLTGSQGLVLALVELIAKLFGLEKDAASGAPLLSAAHENCCLILHSPISPPLSEGTQADDSADVLRPAQR